MGDRQYYPSCCSSKNVASSNSQIGTSYQELADNPMEDREYSPDFRPSCCSTKNTASSNSQMGTIYQERADNPRRRRGRPPGPSTSNMAPRASNRRQRGYTPDDYDDVDRFPEASMIATPSYSDASGNWDEGEQALNQDQLYNPSDDYDTGYDYQTEAYPPSAPSCCCSTKSRGGARNVPATWRSQRRVNPNDDDYDTGDVQMFKREVNRLDPSSQENAHNTKLLGEPLGGRWSKKGQTRSTYRMVSNRNSGDDCRIDVHQPLQGDPEDGMTENQFYSNTRIVVSPPGSSVQGMHMTGTSVSDREVTAQLVSRTKENLGTDTFNYPPKQPAVYKMNRTRSKEVKKPVVSAIKQFDIAVSAELKKRRQKATSHGMQILTENGGLETFRYDQRSEPRQTLVSLMAKSSLSSRELAGMLREEPDSELLDAVDKLALAQEAVAYDGAVRAAQEAAARVPPELAEEAAAAGARTYRAEITDSVQEVVGGADKPIEVLGYIGITRPIKAP